MPECSRCSREASSGRKLCTRCLEANARQKKNQRLAKKARLAGVVEKPIVSGPDQPLPAHKTTTDPLDFEVHVEVPPLMAAQKAYEDAKASRDLKAEHKALFEETTRQRAVIEQLTRMQSAPEILVYRQPPWERSDAIACAIASDWHVEEPVDPEAVHHLNAYNLDIAKARAEKFFTNWLRLTDIMAKDAKITTMFLAALGDFFSGWIHEELLASSLLAPGDAANFVKSLLVSGIDFLLKESSYSLEGEMIPGNHGRMTGKMHFSDPTGTSLETFMYSAIADRYRDNPRVKLSVSGHAMRYRRFYETFNVRLIHGYEVKYGGGIGGITIPIRKALAQWNNPIRANLTLMGHFHQLFDGGDFMVNGSLIGYNTFAQAIKANYEEAQQAFFLISARNGGQKSVVAPIWLDSSHKQKAPSPATSVPGGSPYLP